MQLQNFEKLLFLITSFLFFSVLLQKFKFIQKWNKLTINHKCNWFLIKLIFLSISIVLFHTNHTQLEHDDSILIILDNWSAWCRLSLRKRLNFPSFWFCCSIFVLLSVFFVLLIEIRAQEKEWLTEYLIFFDGTDIIRAYLTYFLLSHEFSVFLRRGGWFAKDFLSSFWLGGSIAVCGIFENGISICLFDWCLLGGTCHFGQCR